MLCIINVVLVCYINVASVVLRSFFVCMAKKQCPPVLIKQAGIVFLRRVGRQATYGATAKYLRATRCLKRIT